MSVLASIITGSSTWADFMFLLAAVLFVVCTVLAGMRRDVDHVLMYLGLAAVAFGLALL